MERIGAILGTMANTAPRTDGKVRHWLPPDEFYEAVRTHAGDRVEVLEGEEDRQAPTCDACDDSGYVVRRKAGANILEDEGRVRPCRYCAARRRAVNYERIGIKEILTFGDWIDVPAMVEARRACDELILGKKRWALLLHAGTGRGKTMLAKCVVHAWVNANKGNAYFTTAPELFEGLRDSYDPAATHTLNALIEFYESRDLLVIDDLGSEYHRPSGDNVVDWIDEKLFRIVDTRWQRKKRTMITTNLRPDSEVIPSRIRSRLAGFEVVIDAGEDFRRRQ